MTYRMTRICCCLLLVCPMVAFGQTASDKDISGSDFLPPVQGGDEQIEKPKQVKIKKDVVEAASAQDAMNAAVRQNRKDLGADPKAATESPEIGAKWLKFGSGVGVLATGMATYSHVPNPTTTRIAQRNAYVVAYIQAKAAMARSVSNISVDGRNVLRTAAREINTDDANVTEEASITVEQLNQSAAALLKGHVTYSTKEIADEKDSEVRLVFVSIVSTPKTQTMVTRQGAVQKVDKLIDGLNEMVLDIKKGLIPPVGGRVITVPSSKQTAFIGFGTAVIGTSRNRALLAKKKLSAQKIAAARARDSLFGIIGGDRVIWQTGIGSDVSEEYKEVLDFAKKDPLAQDHGSIDESLQSYKSSIESNRVISETVESTRKGILPPGIKEKTWLSADGHWAYSLMVYYPPLSNFAAKTARTIRNPKLIAPVDDGSKTSSATRKSATRKSASRKSASRKKKSSKKRTVDGRVKPRKPTKPTKAPKKKL